MSGEKPPASSESRCFSLYFLATFVARTHQKIEVKFCEILAFQTYSEIILKH